MRALVHAITAMAALLALTLLASPAAYAHAQLLSSDPAANTVAAEAPQTVRLVFNEPVTALAISLIGPDGAAEDLLAATQSGETLLVHLPDALAEGTHVLNWRVASTDAHPVGGALLFSVGTETGAAASAISTASRATMVLLWTSKTMAFIALFVGIGGAVFALGATLPTGARRPLIALSALGLVATLASLGLHGADALGLSPDAIFATASWATAASTSYGLTVLLLVVAFVLTIIALGVPAAKRLAWLAWPLAAVALTVSGHAGAADPQWLTRPAVTLHIAGIVFWVGALVPLWLWLRDRSEAANKALAHFSKLIPFAVALLLASGIALAAVQMGPPGPAWATPYGFILGAKLGLLVLLFLLALFNRLSLTTPALAGDLAARHRLRQSILVELILVILVFGFAAGWRFTPPPRAIAAVEAAAALPVFAHAMDTSVMADITITPGRAGPVDIDLLMMDGAGAALEPEAVDVTFSAPTLGIEPFSIPATLTDGIWRVSGQTIPLAGDWDITLDVRISRFSRSRIGTTVQIP